MNLFITLYNEKNPERLGELLECFAKNQANPHIKNVYILNEGLKLQHPLQRPIDHRATYQDVFDYINSVTLKREINIIANSDILFDESLELAKDIGMNDCYAICRQDMPENYLGSSQDAWIFRGPIRKYVDGDFPQGFPGCLAGDTVVNYKRAKRAGGRPISLETLYYKFNDIRCSEPRWKLKDAPTYLQSHDSETGKVIFNRIEKVIQSGIKSTIKVKFTDGTDLILTTDHRVLTPSGDYVPIIDIPVGECVVSRGSMKPVSKGLKRKYAKRSVTYVKYHPFAENKVVKGHKYKRVRTARLIYEANVNCMVYDKFIDCLNNDEEKSKDLIYTKPEIEIHHKDENSLNDTPENLEALTKEEHARIHANGGKNFNVEYTSVKTIESKENYQNIMTYDVQMASPHNNFCANDVIVHNCDNRIAFTIFKAGYNVTNPCFSIKCWHNHKEQKEGNWYHSKEAALMDIEQYNGNVEYDEGRGMPVVKKPYRAITPCQI